MMLKNLFYKPNDWFDKVPEPKRFLILFIFVSFVIISGKILSFMINPIFDIFPIIIFIMMIMYRIAYNIIGKLDIGNNTSVNIGTGITAKKNTPIYIGRELIGKKMIADTNVPEFIEHGIRFLKGKEYEVKDIRGDMIDLIDEYGYIDSFSLDKEFKGNYLWEWFQIVKE